jgi:hypothetical protein
MQKTHLSAGVLAAGGAIALLTACSNGGSQNSTAAIPNANSAPRRSPLARSGIASEYLGLSLSQLPKARFAPEGYVSPDKKTKSPAELFVDNDSPDEVLILANNSWKDLGSITNGATDPDGSWYDKHGLYVANYSAPNVEQYSSKGSLTFTYNAGMSSPVTLTTDSDGNIYEADFTGEAVNEYRQMSNTVVATCQPGGFVEGVAVDKQGDVFVDYYDGEGAIAEYKGGLSGCSETALGAEVSFPGGMVLDKSDDLVICDQVGDAVDIIKPPYGSISGTLGSGYSEPFHVSLNKKNSQAYVTDTGSAFTVDVVSYPRGSRIATLGSSYGVSKPFGAVDGSNFVP